MSEINVGDSVFIRRTLDVERVLNENSVEEKSWPRDVLFREIFRVESVDDDTVYLKGNSDRVLPLYLPATMVQSIVGATVYLREDVTNDELRHIFLAGISTHERSLPRVVERFTDNDIYTNRDGRTFLYFRRWMLRVAQDGDVTTESDVLESYKTLVRETTIEYAEEYDFCEIVDEFLDRLGLKPLNVADTLPQHSVLLSKRNTFVKISVNNDTGDWRDEDGDRVEWSYVRDTPGLHLVRRGDTILLVPEPFKSLS